MLAFSGAGDFRARVVGSILSSRPVLIRDVREADDAPGVSDYEVCFVQLVDKLTNGTAITINATGTVVSVTRPGLVLGGKVEHECVGRAVGYFIEGVLPLCLFAKEPVRLTLTGLTNDDVDLCVDTLKSVTMRLLSRFGAAEPFAALEVVQRGLPPNGRGKVVLSCPALKELRAVQLVDPGFVRKVRGVAYGVRVSPQLTNRMATAARGVFNELLPDVYVSTDHVKGAALDRSGADQLKSEPGYGIALLAESTTGCYYGAQRGAIRQSAVGGSGGVADADEDPQQQLLAIPTHGRRREPAMQAAAHPGVSPVSDPESVATSASFQLLEEIERAGCVDASHQPLLFWLMALCPEDVSRVRIGRLAPAAVATLRVIHDTLGVTFKLKADEADGTLLCSCVGAGYRNLAKKVS
jgi:RNA 3'-terminal phosphate cyclase-like protein